jgi:hypothetical protein
MIIFAWLNAPYSFGILIIKIYLISNVVKDKYIIDFINIDSISDPVIMMKAVNDSFRNFKMPKTLIASSNHLWAKWVKSALTSFKLLNSSIWYILIRQFAFNNVALYNIFYKIACNRFPFNCEKLLLSHINVLMWREIFLFKVFDFLKKLY